MPPLLCLSQRSIEKFFIADLCLFFWPLAVYSWWRLLRLLCCVYLGSREYRLLDLARDIPLAWEKGALASPVWDVSWTLLGELAKMVKSEQPQKGSQVSKTNQNDQWNESSPWNHEAALQHQFSFRMASSQVPFPFHATQIHFHSGSFHATKIHFHSGSFLYIPRFISSCILFPTACRCVPGFLVSWCHHFLAAEFGTRGRCWED